MLITDLFLIFEKDRVRQRKVLDTITHYKKIILEEKIRIKVVKEECLESTGVKGLEVKE